jgi:long-chain acyl-CoA synthetase
MGEYISLGKIEAVIKSSVVVENACVCADSTHSYPVVLVVPAQNAVLKLADEMDIPFDSFIALCRDPRIVSAVLEELQETGRQLNLNKFEIPRKIYLCPEPWLPTSGLVTAAFKIRRNIVYKHYEREIERMYNSS